MPTTSHLDAAAALELRPQLTDPVVVLDLSAVEHVDAAAVALLLNLARQGDLRLAGLRAEVRTILEHLGVRRLFRIYATAALAQVD